MKQEPEYTEGSQAIENFEKMAIAIFQSPKPGGRKNKKSSKKASKRKPKESDKD